MFTQRSDCSNCGHSVVCSYKGRYRSFSNDVQKAAERAKIQAQAEADRAIIAANADLEVVKVQADAAKYAGEKEAEMNKKIAESMTPELSQYYWVKQWDGKLPTTMLGNDTTMMMNMGEMK